VSAIRCLHFVVNHPNYLIQDGDLREFLQLPLKQYYDNLPEQRMMELQVILVELLRTFEFSLPDSRPEIVRMPLGVLQPMLKDEPDKGAQMPLKVKLIA
jgi:hypothetical protein